MYGLHIPFVIAFALFALLLALLNIRSRKS